MMQTLLILAIVSLFGAYLWTLNRTTEGFSTPIPPPPPAYEEPQEDDPRDLPWIASWTIADKFARQGQNCSVKYTEKGHDCTIITTSRSCESGMPHTRAGDRIYIPDSVIEPFRAEILAHERIHLLQRRDPNGWATFYRRSWSFIFYPKPPASMPASVYEAKRGNPDTFEQPWPCWMGRYWPVPVYTNPQAPSLRETVTVWWDDHRRTVLTHPPEQWTAFFGQPSQDEHPHEIAAVMIVAGDTGSEAGRRLMNWWRLNPPPSIEDGGENHTR